MTYAQNGSIQADDFNAFVGGNPTAVINTLNTVWATGGAGSGYGQTAVANVSVGGSIAASSWSDLVTKTSNCALHQGTSITSVTAPTAGSTITYLSAIPSNLSAIYSNRLNAAAQGSTSANTVSTTSTWTDKATWTHVVTFSSGDAARYFFNSGGQLKVTCSHPSGSGINGLLHTLALDIGTIVISSPITGAITVSGVSYNGITKIGGGGNTPTIATNNGYYALTTSNANVFTQSTSIPYGYGYGSTAYVNVKLKSNGAQGLNGDSGSVVTIYTVWDEVPNGITVSSGSTTTVTAHFPETTYLGNTWGSVNIAGSVSVL